MKEVLSLGGGVQSSTLAMMAATGAIPKPDYAVFADTMHEPRHTRTWNPATESWIEGGIYGWMDWLEAQCDFPIHRVCRGDLFEKNNEVRRSKKSGKLYMKGMIPAFVDKGNGKVGLLGRRCTADYKIVPIQRKVKELAGIKRGGQSVIANMWIGISTDEALRIKPSMVEYINNCWPLIDLGMSRQDCLNWMRDNGFPEPPRSACVGCPFHGDDEWANLKNNSPRDFQRAIEAERQMQSAARRQEVLHGIPYLHSTCRPIGEIDFSGAEPGYRQLELFGNECSGMCGV